MKPSARSVAAVRRLAPWMADTMVSALLLRWGWRMAATAPPTRPCPAYDNGALTCLFIGRASPQAEHGVVLIVLALGVWCAIGAAIVLIGAWRAPRAQPAFRAAGVLLAGLSCNLLLCALASFVTPIAWGNDAAPGTFRPLENPGLLLEIGVLVGLAAAFLFLFSRANR